MMSNMDVVVCVSTCDKYRATWVPFCHGFQKYWSDCPWPLWFVTNHRSPPCGKAIKVGDDSGWTDATTRALQKIDVPVIFWMHEDYWLTEPSDTAALLDFADICLRGDADHIQVLPTWARHIRSSGIFSGDPRLLVFADDSEYRTSLQAGFWRVETVLDLLKPGETAWDFERTGTGRSLDHLFLGVKESKYFFYVIRNTGKGWIDQPVGKGRWSKDARVYAKREGLKIDFSRDPKEGSP